MTFLFVMSCEYTCWLKFLCVSGPPKNTALELNSDHHNYGQ